MPKTQTTRRVFKPTGRVQRFSFCGSPASLKQSKHIEFSMLVLAFLLLCCSGSFAAMPPHESLIYGITSALNAATLHTLDPTITRVTSSVLSAGWFERAFDSLNPWHSSPVKPPAGGMIGSSSSSGNRGSTYGSGYSYAWLKALGGLSSLQDLHLDMPLVLPGQVRTGGVRLRVFERGLGFFLWHGSGYSCAWLKALVGERACRIACPGYLNTRASDLLMRWEFARVAVMICCGGFACTTA
jgi:hypothetical protein